MRRVLFSCATYIVVASAAFSQSWNGYGGNPQHSGIYSGNSQSVNTIHWSASLDDNRNYYGGDVLIHYAAPMVTAQNTVVYGYRHTTTSGGNTNYDNWSVIGRSGNDGHQMWRLDTDYSAPLVWPQDWTSVFPITLTLVGTGFFAPVGVAAAGSGGSIEVVSSADGASGAVTPTRLVFYTSLSDFNTNKAAYAPIKINTPLTTDGKGNVYFGYMVTGSVPANVASLGSGGMVKINASTGQAVWKSVQAMSFDSSLGRPAMNAAPALSNDGNSVYYALTGGDGQLVKLDANTLNPTAHVQLLDPSVAGGALLINESSASPMVGPDGHVYMGVFGNGWRESHGWMLQFDGNLSQTDSTGKRFPVGAFGWDDTASVVPASIVPSYAGKSSYLILTKYNNYDIGGGDPGADGSNKVAVLDPGSDSTTKDRQSGIPVMNEVLTVLGPTKTNDDPNHPDARNEWCINSAAIDIKQKCAIINSEDGHMYRWSFVTNTLTQALNLAPATGEAYTSTAIGPDGQCYAINDSILFAVGSPAKASAVSVFQGTSGQGSVQDIWYLDGRMFSVGSVNTNVGQTAAIEADFTFPNVPIAGLNLTVYAAAANGSTGFLYAWNYTTNSFELLGAHPMQANVTMLTATTGTDGAQFLGPQGQVRVVLRTVLPKRMGTNAFRLGADLISANPK